MPRAFRISASLVWPVSSKPIRDGAILVGQDGRIAEVGPDALVSRPSSHLSYHAPGTVLLPGLVNAHVHLELTHLRGAVPEPDFFQWVQHLRRRKSDTAPEQFREAALTGLREMWAGGVTTVADTGDSGAAAQALSELGGRGIAYVEVFGPHPDQAAEAMAGLAERVHDLRSSAGPHVMIGVSPHAPYTVSAPLYRDVVSWARANRLPIAVHLAESKAELAFVSSASGPFTDLWRRRSIPLPRSAPTPVVYLDRLGILGDDVLVIHATQATATDLALLGQRRCSVALCPGSNARHGHGDPPVQAFLGAGVRAGLGTDSAASLDRLDLFAEARAVRRLTSLEAEALIRLLTQDCADALGLGASVGSLEPGKWADLCLCEVSPAGPDSAVAGRLIDQGTASVRATWIGGRLVNGALPTVGSVR